MWAWQQCGKPEWVHGWGRSSREGHRPRQRVHDDVCKSITRYTAESTTAVCFNPSVQHIYVGSDPGSLIPTLQKHNNKLLLLYYHLVPMVWPPANEILHNASHDWGFNHIMHTYMCINQLLHACFLGGSASFRDVEGDSMGDAHLERVSLATIPLLIIARGWNSPHTAMRSRV